MRGPHRCSCGYLSVLGQVHLVLCFYNVGNSGTEKGQNLNTREGALGRGKVGVSQWFRQQSVSTVDVKLPSWVHRWPTHAQAAYLHCLAPTHSCMSLLWAVRSHQLIERFYIHFFSLLWGKYYRL